MLKKKLQNWKKNTLVFNSVHFSPRVIISFQLFIYQVIFLNLKNLFSHCFSTFFSFRKLERCSYIGKFWYIYVIRIKTSLPIYSNPPFYFIWLNFPAPCWLRSLFIRDLRVNFQNTYFSKHLIWMATSKVKGYETSMDRLPKLSSVKKYFEIYLHSS